MMEVKSALRSYTIREADNFPSAVQDIVSRAGVFALVDKFFATAGQFQALPSGRCLFLDGDESAKSFGRLDTVYGWLLENGFRRDSLLLVVGGGVLQDVGCFVASTLMRGVRWVLVPTTLLSQCDSCLGSKSSINFGKFKNQIGTYYPPEEIVLCEGALATLPPDELRSGMGEVIKLHLIEGGQKWRWLRELIELHGAGGVPLGQAVRSSLEIKKPFVEDDEFDKGRRNLLNYGHTFGHAYESVSGFAIPHGIAVSLGVLTATFVSSRLGWVNTDHAEFMAHFLRPFFDPYQEVIRALPMDALVRAMKLDKKAAGGALNCILTRGPGAMEKAQLAWQDAEELLQEFVETLS